MTSINISTIKQYFWYFDKFNTTRNISNMSKQFLPVLSIKHKYYIFSHVRILPFDEIITNKLFPYDNEYKYGIFSYDALQNIFSKFSLIFIDIDENLNWHININDLLIGNEFYDMMNEDGECIPFAHHQPDVVIPKKSLEMLITPSISSEKIKKNTNTNSNLSLSSPHANSDEFKVTHKQIDKLNLLNDYIGGKLKVVVAEIDGGLDDGIFGEFVIIEINDADI